MTVQQRDRLSAVLGPTNTGKTYLAIERMLGHASGMMGFPLRLLARENYDRVVRQKGARQVALITGEEKIIPPSARYFLCTVESMPVDRPVEFLAVDEIQLAADPERGHVFTDRLLHARGRSETMFLGADTIRPLLTRLVPEAEILGRPRFSTLSYAGPRKLTRLPPRSAVVAFSAAEVYGLAELIRRQRGGTAVVLGALSPRTRNAQVGMFESGEVDYLVATDAIGMGLNLGLDHVAFARLKKFDGHSPRHLRPAEVAQIAGRAGRHMSDGTFGTTASLGAMDETLIEAVEEHRFAPLTALSWRNRRLDFRSAERLLRSLEAPPPSPELIRVRPPEDQQALSVLSRDRDLLRDCDTPEAVRLLWDVCQIPDFRKTLTDQHSRLLRQIYLHLRRNDGRLPDDWVAAQIARIDRTQGDIDALVARIAHVRTWTFVTHRADWLADAGHWQDRARALENKLSDALHERLTQRFVDRRTTVLVKRLKAGERLLAAVRGNGEVLVEGEHVGQLEGFRFALDSSVAADDERSVLAATRRALAGEIPQRLARLIADNDGAFRLDGSGRLLWREQPVAALGRGDAVLRPQVLPFDSEFLDGPARERLRRRLESWLERHLRNRLRPLFDLQAASLQGAARGIAFQVSEALGTLPRAAVGDQLAALGRADRKALAALGLRLGAYSVYLPALARPPAQHLNALLLAVHRSRPAPLLPDPPPASFVAEAAWDETLCHALGYRRIERRGKVLVVRADAMERTGQLAFKLAAKGPFAATAGLRRISGCAEAELPLLLAAVGFRRDDTPEGPRYRPRPNRRQSESAARGDKRPGRRSPAPGGAAAESPFAILQQLRSGS